LGEKIPFHGYRVKHQPPSSITSGGHTWGREQWHQLSKYLEAEGVNVFEITSILEKALDSATLGERRRMVEQVWRDMPVAPKAEDLTVEQLLRGYPSKLYYDKGAARVVLPDFQRVGCARAGVVTLLDSAHPGWTLVRPLEYTGALRAQG